MLTAEQREETFRKELQDLLRKHRADIEVDVDFYGTAEVLVSMDSLWVAGDLVEDYSSFFLDRYMSHTDLNWRLNVQNNKPLDVESFKA